MATSLEYLSEEFRSIIRELFRFTEDLNKQVSHLAKISDTTNENSNVVVNAIDEFARGAQEQAEDVQESVLSLESLNQDIIASHKLADEVLDFSVKMEDQQQIGNVSVSSLVKEISNTLKVIGKLNEDKDKLNNH